MKKILYISVILNVLALLMMSVGVSALSVSKEVQDLVGYVQSMIFTDDGTPSGNVKVRISGGEGMIYGSGGIWIGKGGGNGIYSNGTNVGIGTTDLSNRLNIGGDVGVKNESKVKMGLNGNSYVQGTGNIMNIVSQGYVNMEGVRNYIRGGVVTFGSTWYDENDNNYFLDLNNNSKLSNLNSKGLITINTEGNAELDIKSGSLGHWGIYHDTASEDLRFRNGGLNRLSIGKGGEIYTNNGILVDGSKNWKGNMFMSNVGGTGLISCSEGETLIWDGINNKWKCGSIVDGVCGDNDLKILDTFPSTDLCSSGTPSNVLYNTGMGTYTWTCNGLKSTTCKSYDNYTKLLLHFDGNLSNNGSNTGIITNNGSVITTSDGKFGKASYFNGSNYLFLNDSEDWNFGSTNFTIDFWFKYYGNNNCNVMLGQSDSGSSDLSIQARIGDNSPVANYYLTSRVDGNDGTIYRINSTYSIDDKNWHHYALVRNGMIITQYVDGISNSTFNVSNMSVRNSVSKLAIGKLGEYTNNCYFYGYLDELRISKGIARRTNNFVLPLINY